MGKYFSIEELCASSVAKAHGIDNTPNLEEKKNLENLIKVLDIIREEFGSPITINSGFRNLQLNSHPKIKGSKTSWHMKGMAADLSSRDNQKLWDLIVNLQKVGKIQFTELINEYPDKNGKPTWVHLAVNPSNLKNQVKVIK